VTHSDFAAFGGEKRSIPHAPANWRTARRTGETMANIKIVGGFMLDDALIEKIMELEHQVLNLEAYAEHTHAAFREVSEERDRLTVEVERLRAALRFLEGDAVTERLRSTLGPPYFDLTCSVCKKTSTHPYTHAPECPFAALDGGKD
jgi:regulator of replication initiation timing